MSDDDKGHVHLMSDDDKGHIPLEVISFHLMDAANIRYRILIRKSWGWVEGAPIFERDIEY